MNDQTDDPNLRRVSLDDLPWPHTIPKEMPSTPPSSPSGSNRPPNAAVANECGCRGVGYYTLPVPFGHADFGKLIRCVCGQTLDSARARARLQDELGALSDKTFDTFSLDRPLTPIY